MCDLFAKDISPFRISRQRGLYDLKRKYKGLGKTKHETIIGRFFTIIMVSILTWFLYIKIQLMISQ